MARQDNRLESLLEKSIFASRWLQAPLYIGLIVAQGIYVYQFFIELWHLLHSAFAGHVPAGSSVPDLSTFIMLNVLGLIDVVMIANLLIMVIIGGYETFVSRLHLDDLHRRFALDGAAQPRQRGYAQGEAGHRAHQYFFDPFIKDVYYSAIESRAEQPRRDVAGYYSRGFRIFCHRARVDRQAHDGWSQSSARYRHLALRWAPVSLVGA